MPRGVKRGRLDNFRAHPFTRPVEVTKFHYSACLIRKFQLSALEKIFHDFKNNEHFLKLLQNSKSSFIFFTIMISQKKTALSLSKRTMHKMTSKISCDLYSFQPRISCKWVKFQ